MRLWSAKRKLWWLPWSGISIATTGGLWTSLRCCSYWSGFRSEPWRICIFNVRWTVKTCWKQHKKTRKVVRLQEDHDSISDYNIIYVCLSMILWYYNILLYDILWYSQMSDTETLRQLFAKRSSGLRISAASSTAHRAIPRHFWQRCFPLLSVLILMCHVYAFWAGLIMCMIRRDSWER